MKTAFAALAISLLAAAPSIASESSNIVRRAERSATIQLVAVVNVAPAPVARDVPARNVRVVLASPFGN